MKTGHKLTAAIAAGAAIMGLSLAGLAQAQSQDQPGNRFAAQLLDAHNQERERFGASRLQWSPKPAREAQQWAVLLAEEGRMRHASKDERGGAGENLWMGTAGRFPATRMVGSFIEENSTFALGPSRKSQLRAIGAMSAIIRRWCGPERSNWVVRWRATIAMIFWCAVIGPL